MSWTPVWLPSAKSTWLRLRSEEQRKVSRYVEEFAAGATDDEGAGLLQVGRWWVGIMFETDANYTDDSGDEATGDVIWVVSLHVPPPDDVDADDLYLFEVEEEDEDESGF
jgi:hypothetical protein